MLERWALWLCLGAFIVFYGLRILRDARNIFAPPLLLALLVCTILVKPYFDYEPLALAILLDSDYYVMTLAYAVLCLLAFSLFYERGLRAPSPIKPIEAPVERLPVGAITAYVAIIAGVGAAAQLYVANQSGGLLAFYSSIHGAAADFSSMSAYVYALPSFMWSAMLIGYIGLEKAPRRQWVLLILTLAIGAALFAHTFLFGNRNGVIRLCIILGAAYAFIHRPSVVRSLPLMVILMAGFVVVMVIANLREHLNLGSDVPLTEAVSEYLRKSGENGGKRVYTPQEGGNEMFFNVAVVQAAWVSGTYDYGAAYIYPFINFIPRATWSEKPYEADFVVNYFQLASSVVGWTPPAGAAISAVAQSFLAFSWFGALVWGVLGFWSARTMRFALSRPGFLSIGALTSCLIGIVFWGTQSFAASFFAWFFSIMPFVGLRIIARHLGPSLVRSRPANIAVNRRA